MAKKTVEILVVGAKATPGPPLGPALGPLGLNLIQVVAEINKKTADYAGMSVPVKIIADQETREFEIEVGTPPVSALIKKSLSIEKGSGRTGSGTVGNLPLSEIIKIARTKGSSMLSYGMSGQVKEVLGTCVSMGVQVEGMHPREVQRLIDEGKYREMLTEG